MDVLTVVLIVLGVLFGIAVIIGLLGWALSAFLNSSGGNPFR